MDDISPNLLKQIQDLFAEDVSNIREAIKTGLMDYEEAYAASIEIGSALSRAFNTDINAEILPDGRMYYNIANKVVMPMLREEHDLVAQAAVQAQQNANKAAGIGIRAQAAEFDEDRAKGIIDRVSSEPYDDIKWILDEPVKSFAKNVVDRTLQKNVEFQGQSGLHPKIVRRASAGACEWCQAVAGTYSYPDVPHDVYRRHANCDCVVEYVEGGKYQDIWTKKLINPRERVNISSESERKRRSPEDILQGLSAMQDSRNVSIPASVKGIFEDFRELTISEEEKKELISIRDLSESTGYEYAAVRLSDGTVDRKTSYLPDKVYINITSDDGSGIQILHSHTNVTPLSGNDFKFLCNEQVDSIGNIAINGDTYICRVGNGIRPTEEELNEDKKRIAKEVDSDILEMTIENGWTPEEATYMAIREQAYRIARYYEWELEGGHLGNE